MAARAGECRAEGSTVHQVPPVDGVPHVAMLPPVTPRTLEELLSWEASRPAHVNLVQWTQLQDPDNESGGQADEQNCRGAWSYDHRPYWVASPFSVETNVRIGGLPQAEILNHAS